MIYLTGVHALNLECELETTGDWHTSALKWEKLDLRDSKDSIFKDWGIERSRRIPNGKHYPVANHLRAILDIMEKGTEYEVKWLGGFREDFICTRKYDKLFFNKVIELRSQNNWEQIDSLMGKEFKMDWVRWKADKS